MRQTTPALLPDRGEIDPAPIAVIEIAGHRMPGAAEVLVESVTGTAGKATVRLTVTDLIAFEAIRAELQPSKDGQLLAVRVHHPWLQIFGWRRAFVRRISEPEASRLAGTVELVLELEDATNVEER
jgi:hypothetical protein